MVSSSSTHTHTPHPLWHADGVRQPGEEGGDGNYGWGEQGPSSPHLPRAETTQKALSLPLPWVGGLVPCAWMVGGTGGFKKTGCVVVVKGMTMMTQMIFYSFPSKKILTFLISL